jgi:Na+-driven multidrug efflux pump
MEILSLFPLFASMQSFLSGILNNFWDYKVQMYTSVIIAIINIILNTILINYIWIIWISIATIFSYFLWSIYFSLFIKELSIIKIVQLCLFE